MLAMDSMVLVIGLRRQARVCARLAEDCEDQHLAERLKAMAASLAEKAEDIEELSPDPRKRLKTPLAA